MAKCKKTKIVYKTRHAATEYRILTWEFTVRMCRGKPVCERTTVPSINPVQWCKSMTNDLEQTVKI